MYPAFASCETKAGTPYTEGTGLICRVPSIRLPFDTLGFSPRGTSAGSGYVCSRFIFVPFSRAPDMNRILQRNTHPKFNQVLIVMILPRFVMVNAKDFPRRPPPKREKQNLCCHAYLNSRGILTSFPFPRSQIMSSVRND